MNYRKNVITIVVMLRLCLALQSRTTTSTTYCGDNRVVNLTGARIEAVPFFNITLESLTCQFG